MLEQIKTKNLGKKKLKRLPTALRFMVILVCINIIFIISYLQGGFGLAKLMNGEPTLLDTLVGREREQKRRTKQNIKKQKQV